MMPGITESHPSNINYKQKYKTLKRKLKFLVNEQECFLEELRKAQRKLIKVSRDRSFLLDRLLQYEKIDDSSSDSDATASSESDAEGHRDLPRSGKKKKISSSTVQLPMFSGSDPSLNAATLGFSGMLPGQANLLVCKYHSKTPRANKKKAKASSKKIAGTTKSVTKTKSPSSSKKTASSLPGVQMTREEIERHLDSTQRNKPQFLSIEKVASDLPMEIFSNDNSNVDSEAEVLLTEDGQDDHDLIIDLPE